MLIFVINPLLRIFPTLMQPPTPETLFITIDRAASELLWSVAQLTAQPIPEALRERTTEVLDIVISGLRLNQDQLAQPTKESRS